MSELPPEALAPEPGPLPEVPAASDAVLPPADRDLGLAWRLLGIAVVVACCAVVFQQLNPALLLRDTTANGGDMGAHVWFPAYLRDHLLPSWRVAGWSPDWFAGFPAGQFYFPLPALLVVALDVVLPYNVAFKLVTALGPVLLPASAYFLGRGLKLRRPGPELFAVATTLFLFFKGIGAAPATHDATIQFNQRIMGGPIVSALAGEYSFTLALAFGIACLGALAFALRERRRLWLPAVLLAATVLCHIVVGIFVLVGALIVWLFHRPVRTFTVAGAIGVVGGLLTAFWTVPLLATFGFTANMRYEKLTWYLDYLFPGELWWVVAFAVIGAVIGAIRRDRAVLTLLTITVTFAVVFRLWPELHAWNLRFLPFWYLGLFLLAAVGVAEIVRGIAQQTAVVWLGPGPELGDDWALDPVVDGRRFRLVKTALAVAMVLALAAGGLFYAHQERGFLDFWAEWNYSGYQDTSPSSTKPKPYGEYHDLMTTMGKLAPGRAMWEGGQALDAYGTSLSLMLLPYWTHGRIASMEGLYYESAATTPFHFMAVAPLSGPGNASNPVRGLDYRTIADFDLGVRYLQLLGVRYYMAYSADAKTHADANQNLKPVAKVRDRDHIAPLGWKIYEVRGSATVAPLTFEPVVVTPHAGTQSECFGRKRVAGEKDPELGPWECLAAGWWNDPNALDRPLAAGGPAGWERVPASEAESAPRRRLPKVTVSGIHQTDSSVSFRVSRTGVPVVVRTSYFPNWEASGAQGPWRLTPNFMVVVPTSHTVTLRYARSGPEIAGIALSVLGFVGLAGLVVWRPRTPGEGRREDSGEETPGTGPSGSSGDGADIPSGVDDTDVGANSSERTQAPGLP
ncbi:MAG: 6-pyruvoyl-tetrahydropterin synthase-related protein [Acidimicrobiia bacterium]